MYKSQCDNFKVYLQVCSTQKIYHASINNTLILILYFYSLQTPVIPPTITDQIRLWELERDRFKFNDGVLYSQFLSQSDFEMLRDYARVCLLFSMFLFIV